MSGFFEELQRRKVYLFEWFDSTGYAVDIESLRRDFPEVKWHTFEEWARKQDLIRQSNEPA